MIKIEVKNNKLDSDKYFSQEMLKGSLCLSPKSSLGKELFELKSDSTKVQFNLSKEQELNLVQEQESEELSIQFNLEEKSKLNFVMSQVNATKKLISNLAANLGEGSELSTFYLSASSVSCKNYQTINLNKKNATANLKGLYISEEKNTLGNEILINHKFESTFSDQLFKGVLLDSAKTIFKGRVHIEKEAQLSDSAQLNKNLLLSKSASAVSMPELEVFADDVSATHGSTVGDIDPEKLFYLVSRGIPRAKALQMLTFGFVEDVINKTENQSIRDYLENKTNKILSKIDLAKRILE